MIHPELIESAVKGYTEALLWANAYDEGMESFGDAHLTYDLSDFSEVDQAYIINDVWDFVMNNAVDFALYILLRGGTGNISTEQAESFGHDFLLTSSGHGTGFWDRGLPDDLGDRLTNASKLYGDPHVTVLNDGTLAMD